MKIQKYAIDRYDSINIYTYIFVETYVNKYKFSYIDVYIYRSL